MKKFYAIVLALALVLGFASIASADFKISGQFVVSGNYDIEGEVWEGVNLDGDTRFEIKLSATYGDVSGDMTYRFKSSSWEFRQGNMMYKFSDEFSLGWVWDKTGTDLYVDMLDSNEAIEYDNSDVWMKMAISLGDFNATVLNNVFEAEELAVRAGATYNLDPVTIGCGLVFFQDIMTTIVPGVKYNLTDEFAINGEVLYETESEITVAGAGVTYETDELFVEAGFFYELEFLDDFAQYFLTAAWKFADNMQLEVYYYDSDVTAPLWLVLPTQTYDWDEGLTIDLFIWLDEGEKTQIKLEYLDYDEEFYGFDPDYTDYFNVEFLIKF